MEQLAILKNDPWLEPYAEAIEGRHEDAVKKEAELIAESGTLNAFANAHHYFGLHRTADGGWVLLNSHYLNSIISIGSNAWQH